MESSWEFSKRMVTATHGIVAAKHPLAARVGLEILRRGGNAVDAAVATAFAVGVVEPWMSGLGGGGVLVMVPGRSSNRDPVVVDFGVRSPAAAHARMYVLEDSYDEDLFGWRSARGQANVHGPLSVTVPGVPAGLALTLAHHGTMPLAEIMRPAIALARDGFAVDWTTTLEIALDAAVIRMYPDTAELFLPDGGPVVPSDTPRPRLLRQPALARTLEAIAEEGPDAFYRGPVGRQIAEGVRHRGGILTADDLSGYEAREYPAYVSAARGREIAVPPGATGGVTLAEMLNILEGASLRALGHNTAEYLHLIIEASRAAFADRLSLLAEGMGADVVTSLEHAAARRKQISPNVAAQWNTPGRDSTSTTHLCVVDASGTAVSLTQTLLSRFGSRLVIPETGVLLNNGMMWFNPEPGHVNSIGPNKRPLANMTPAIVMDGGRPVLAVGASGGRRIIDAVLQIILNVFEFGMDVQAALAAPRVDVSTPEVVVDARIAQGVQDGLRTRGHGVVPAAAAVSPHFFASPVAISRDPETGLLTGGVDPYHPAVAAGY